MKGTKNDVLFKLRSCLCNKKIKNKLMIIQANIILSKFSLYVTNKIICVKNCKHNYLVYTDLL